MAQADRDALVERASSLEAIGELLAGAAAGRGGVLVLEGEAGLGKSALLRAAREDAAEAGLQVLAAQGGELEQEMPWGVARELLTRVARTTVPGPPAAAVLGVGPASGGDDVAALHALTMLCADAAELRPLVLLVDDAHWADPPSVRWLAYLAARVADLPVAVIAAARPVDPRRPVELTVLAGRDGVRGLRLQPLTDAGTAAIVRRTLPDADAGLQDACARATGGNPFLVHELVVELGNREAVTAATVADLAIDRVDRVVARRLVAAGTEGTALARAIAVLGSDAAAPLAARLAGLEDDAARRAADALQGTSLLVEREGARLGFSHPLVRSAVERAIPAGERTAAHLTAARLIAADDGDPRRVAAHLLAVEPGTDPWVRTQLAAAAEQALAERAPRAALDLCERALAERCGPADADLRRRAGRAALVVQPAVAVHHLQAAYAAADDLPQRIDIALEIAVALQGASRWAEAVALLDDLDRRLQEDGAPRALWLRVRAELLAQTFFDEQYRPRWRAWLDEVAAELDPDSDGDAALPVLLQQAVAQVTDGTAGVAGELARRAWAGGRLVDSHARESPAVWWAVYVGLYTGDLELADAAVRRTLRDAARDGSATALAYGSTQLAELELRRGDLRASLEAADAAWRICAELGPEFWCWWITLAARVQAHVARGQAGAALELLAAVGLADGELPPVMSLPLLRAARPAARIVAGDAAAGVPELLEAHRWIAERAPSPGGWLTATQLVDGLLVLGRREEAEAHARAWVADTEAFGSRLTIGLARRALGLCLTGAAQLAELTRAEAALAATPARHEHARALVELGAALRRGNQRAAAREPLRRALDLATRSGADATATRAREELAASGAQVRRVLLDGVDALTASELRVARLAAEGASNPEIAATLFVTRKTVEKHLGNAYLKLGVGSRAELPEALAPSA